MKYGCTSLNGFPYRNDSELARRYNVHVGITAPPRFNIVHRNTLFEFDSTSASLFETRLPPIYSGVSPSSNSFTLKIRFQNSARKNRWEFFSFPFRPLPRFPGFHRWNNRIKSRKAILFARLKSARRAARYQNPQNIFSKTRGKRAQDQQ